MRKMIYITDTNDADVNYIRDSKTITVFKGLNLLEVNHPADAVQSSEYLKLLNHYDIFLLSNSRKTLSEARNVFDYTRLIYEPKTKFKTFDELVKRAFKLNLFTVCLEPKYATQRQIRELHHYGIKVIIRVNNQLEVYKAALAGADGVIGRNIEKVELVGDISTLPFLVSHRGYHVDQVENSIKSGLMAYEHGADVLEMDVHLTADDEVVVNHDRTLGRTYNKDLVIKYNTLNELKQARQKLGNQVLEDAIPTLAEMDKALPEDLTFLVETKVETQRAIKAISKVVNKMKRNVMVMSFYPIALINMDESMPNNINGLLVSLDGENMDLLSMLKVINKYRLIVHPHYPKQNKELEKELKARMIGYSPWGIPKNKLDDVLFEGHDMINSDYVHLLSHMPKRIVVKRKMEYQQNDKMEIKVYDEKGDNLDFKTHILFDNPLGLEIKDNKIVGAKKKSTAYMYVTHTAKIIEKEITYASDLIEVEVL